MKKICSVFLVIVLLLSLCGCQSEEAKNVQTMIDAIGTVTADSDSAIAAAEAAYAALSDKDKETVENYGLLAEARTACNAAMDREAADAVSAMITAIGEVTADSEEAITAAEEAYAALNAEAQALVTNADALADAREAYTAAAEAARFEEFRLSLMGDWVNEVTNNYYNALEDTNCMPRDFEITFEDGETDTYSTYGFSLEENGDFFIRFCLGTWTLSEDMTTVTLNVEQHDVGVETLTFQVIQEDGFTKLLGELPNNRKFAYVKDDDYEEAFQKKYAAVELTDENVRDYIGDVVSFEDINNTQVGRVVDAHFFTSNAYDDGLVYLGCNYCDVDFAWEQGGAAKQADSQFPVYWWTTAADNCTNIRIGDSAYGTMFYVKAEYVAENYINEDGYRTLVLTNGVEMVFDGYGDFYDRFWNNVGANYEDYIY